MASLRTKFNVGLFVIIGFSLTIVAIVWFGLSHRLEKGNYFVAYFDESVQGLDTDSPVKYRGVSVGRVIGVNVAPDATLIETTLKIDTDVEPIEDLVAQLKSVGITGIMFVELDRKMPGDVDQAPQITFPSKYPIIATKPSDIKKFVSGLDDLLAQFRSFDLPGISAKVKSALSSIDQAAADLKTAELTTAIQNSLGVWDTALTSVDSAASSLESLSQNVDTVVNENEENLKSTVVEMRQAIANVSHLVNQGSVLLKHTDSEITQLTQHLRVTLINLERASIKLDQTLEMISDQPSQLLFGDPPPHRK